jgi:hypothetical protein
VPECLLLLCVASGIDFKHVKIAERVVTDMLVRRTSDLLSCVTNPGNRPLGIAGLDRRAGLGP